MSMTQHHPRQTRHKLTNSSPRPASPGASPQMVGPLASDATPRTPRAWRDGAGALSAEERLARPKSCPVPWAGFGLDFSSPTQKDVWMERNPNTQPCPM